jgi:hypothetical protein
MPWLQDWFFNSTIKGLLHHGVDSLAAGGIFAVIGKVLSWIFPDPQTVWFIKQTESILIACLFVIFGLKLFLVIVKELIAPIKELWQFLKGGWNGTHSLVAL